jgi:ATP-dependent protease ClpP protease subunit
MKANESLEDLLMLPQEQKGLIRTITQQMHTHLVFIDDDITDPRNYRDVIHCLATCSENDSVNLLVNSSGGRTDSIWQIIEAMKGCRGDVSVTVIGAAYSAASMLACMAPECYIAESAEFMLHTAHYGSIGTVPNVKGQTDFATRQINRLLDTAYKGFLTDKELQELKNGKEFWFDAEEAGKRMTRRYKYLRGLSNLTQYKKVKPEVEVE